MHASPESASSKAPTPIGERVLVCGVNWIGDTVISLPALQAYRRLHPGSHISLLVKPGLVPLWKMHAAPNEILILEEGLAGTLRTVRRVRAGQFRKAVVLPHSFRSALVPWLAGIPARVGMPGHWRDAMLTDVVVPEERPGRRHQAYEYVDLFCPEEKDKDLDLPRLSIAEDALAAAAQRLSALPSPRVALLPGAARGPSKRWPAERFVRLGRMLRDQAGCGVVVLGVTSEAALCAEVAEGIGPEALDLAGRTNLAEWIALLKACQLVIANDSGGMHLAAAMGTPVVAIFGITDPAKTGPMGPACRVIQNSTFRRRDIGRYSVEARKSLESIEPDQVYGAAMAALGRAAPDAKAEG